LPPAAIANPDHEQNDAKMADSYRRWIAQGASLDRSPSEYA
jgi:hypothetical protein